MPSPTILMTSVTCKPSSIRPEKCDVSLPNSSVKLRKPSPTPWSKSLMVRFSQALFKRSREPRRLSMATLAVSWAVMSFMAAFMSLTPLAPSRSMIMPPRIASEPNMVDKAFIFSSSVKPDRCSCKRPAMSERDRRCPSWSKNLDVPSSVKRPSLCISSVACFVCGERFMSIVFKDVPASDPFRPLLAKTAKAVLVSSKLMPTPAATAETAEREYFNSWTPVALALAAPTNTSAA